MYLPHQLSVAFLHFPLQDRITGRAVVISVIDNLVKGASGQAIQNMNLMFDFPETTSLMQLAMFP